LATPLASGKTLTCGDLTESDIGREVVIKGWVNSRRDHGGVIFLDLRDRWGVTQTVFNPDRLETFRAVEPVRNEWVLAIAGTVRRRPSGTNNPRLATGAIEVSASSVEVLNPSLPPPFEINDDAPVEESLRLKYRYLDLRRPRMVRNLTLRHHTVKFIRDFLSERGFLEVETPIMMKSTPEGARDYLVPSRLHPGEFYALPQSPQQLKQLLMVAGVERYFQIARCFRDEDLRADRQPEFTQLDLEMSFVEQEDVLALAEELFIKLTHAVTDKTIMRSPFPRLTYQESMETYGNDKPDLRFGLEIRDLSASVAESEFKVFSGALASGGSVRGLCVPEGARYSRRQIDELTALAQSFGAKGLVWIAVEPGEGGDGPQYRSPIARFLQPAELEGVRATVGANVGDLILAVADSTPITLDVLGRLRAHVGEQLGLADPNVMAYAFIVEPPLLEWQEDEARWDALHHPFTSPAPGQEELLQTDPGSVKALAYDIVCNGYELGSGSIRIHQREVQMEVFRRMNYSDDEIEARFGHLLTAFTYGAPPHGGIAPGIDRWVMLLANEPNIREVIPFPKNQAGVDLMLDAPSPVDDHQLAELHLARRPPATR